MDDLISRKAAIEVVQNRHMMLSKEKVLLINDIEKLPSAQPKRGKWRHYEGVLTCSECASEFYDTIMEFCGDDVPHFCPDCGAEMKGVIE